VIASIALILACQLAGETLARGLGLPLPGPVLGMAALCVVLALRARLGGPAWLAGVEPAGRFLLAHLSLLFVPAGVGVIGNLEVLSAQWLALAAALAGSTLLTLLVSVATFRLVSRAMGQG
jgi:holin-like protein